MSTVLQDFLVSLRFQVDPTSQTQANNAVSSMTKNIMKLGVAAIATTSKILNINQEWINSNVQAQFSVRNLGMNSIQSFKAMTKAAQSVGLSVDDMLGSIQNIQNMRFQYGSGAEGLLKLLNPDIKATDSPEEVLRKQYEGIQNMKKQGRSSVEVNARAQAAGLDQNTARIMFDSNAYSDFEKQRKAFTKETGTGFDDHAEQAKTIKLQQDHNQALQEGAVAVSSLKQTDLDFQATITQLNTDFLTTHSNNEIYAKDMAEQIFSINNASDALAILGTSALAVSGALGVAAGAAGLMGRAAGAVGGLVASAGTAIAGIGVAGWSGYEIGKYLDDQFGLHEKVADAAMALTHNEYDPNDPTKDGKEKPWFHELSKTYDDAADLIKKEYKDLTEAASKKYEEVTKGNTDKIVESVKELGKKAVDAVVSPANADETPYVAPTGKIKDKEKAAMQYLMNKGLNSRDASDITANLESESNLNPKTFGHGAEAAGGKSEAYGMLQWHRDRRKNFERLFGHTMESVTDETKAFTEQLDFAYYEITKGAEKGNWERGHRTNKGGSIYSREVVRPAGKEGAAAYRGKMAEKIEVNNHITVNGNVDPKKTGAEAGKMTTKAMNDMSNSTVNRTGSPSAL